jgi:hypothetical protein
VGGCIGTGAVERKSADARRKIVWPAGHDCRIDNMFSVDRRLGLAVALPFACGCRSSAYLRDFYAHFTLHSDLQPRHPA